MINGVTRRLNYAVIQTEAQMKIRKINNQSRRDFYATYECEHCGHTEDSQGYDDPHFHQNVIPAMKCKSCGLTARDDYRPLATKYPEHTVV